MAVSAGRGISPRILKSSGFWITTRVFTSFVLVWMISVSLNRWDIQGVSVPDPLMYTNAGNTLFWVVWIMGLVILAPLAGRAWCGVCPLGYLNELVSRWGLARPFPRCFKNLYLMAFSLFFTVLLLGLLNIHHFPGATAIYLTGWAVLAVVLGLVFRERSMCSHICPIGGMLGLYSRLSLPDLGVADEQKCRTCRDRECVQGVWRRVRMGLGCLGWELTLRRHPCPVGLTVWDMRGPDRCLLCFNCMRICSHDNVRLRARMPFTTLWRDRHTRFSELAVMAVLLGFLMLSFLRFWPGLQDVVAAGPSALSGLAGPESLRFIYLSWAGFVLPLLLLLWPAVLVRGLKVLSMSDSVAEPLTTNFMGRFPLRFWIESAAADTDHGQDHSEERVLYGSDSVRSLATAFLPVLVPVLLGGHFILALVKLNAKLPYFFLGLSDPVGIRTYMAIEELGLVGRPEMIFPIGIIRGVSVFVLTCAFLLSMVAAKKVSESEGVPFLPFAVQIILVGSIFAGGLRYWLF